MESLEHHLPEPLQSQEHQGSGRGYEWREKFTRTAKYCGLAALGAFMEFVATHPGFGQELETAKESPSHKVSYRTAETQKRYSGYERFYPKFDDLKIPVVVGSLEDERKNLSEADQALFEALFGKVAALTFAGSARPAGARTRFNLGRDTVYIFYGPADTLQEAKVSTPYHEGMHARHMAQERAQNANDTLGFIRYPDLSTPVNLYLEEFFTGAETVRWLETQANDAAHSVVDSSQQKYLPKSIEEEKKYLLMNYMNYYQERYGSKFEIPFGEGTVGDTLDKQIETLFRDNHLIEVLHRVAQEAGNAEK